MKLILVFRSYFLLFLIPLLVSSQQRQIQYSDRAEQTFRQGLDLFERQDYRAALARFNEILDIGSVTHRTTAAYLMSAKAMIELGQNREAVRRLQLFLDRFPRSLYTADTYFTIGIGFFRERRYDDALFNFLRAVELANGQETRGYAEAYIANIISNHISTDELRQAYEDSRGDYAPGYLALALGQRYMTTGNLLGAREILEKTLEKYWQHPLAPELRLMLERVGEGVSVKIGVILPLFEHYPAEPVARIGRELLQGIRYAVDEHNAHSSVKIYLDVRDSERLPSRAARHVQELVNDNEVIAVIGPIFSDEVFATAGVANSRGVPLITPTATADHIAAVGRYIFQTNPDYRTRGRLMARFAVEKMGYKNLAVLAPADSHGKDIAEGFRDEVGNLDGAYIMVNEWYRTGETNFRQQFYNIRSRGLQDSLHLYISFSGNINRNDIMKLASFGVSIQKLDSLIEHESAVPVVELLGPEGARIADSLGIRVFTGDFYADSLHIAVESIDAIFLPITSSSEMGIVAAQLAYYNVRTQMLGSGEWFDILALEENRRYVNGTYFLSDSYWDTDDPDFIKFYDGFTQKMRSRPTRESLLAYDTVKLLSQILVQGATSRETIAQMLSSNMFFRGIHSPIVMGPTRVNAAKNVLRYLNGEIQKIDEIILN
jgi:branched-chain amino acid transport system substrate-binding protein